MRQDDAIARQRLGEKQFHRTLVDLAGDCPGRAAHRPDAEDRQHQRMDVADGQDIQRLPQVYRFAADDGLDQLSRPLEQYVDQSIERDLLRYRGDDFLSDPLGDLRPDALKSRKQEADYGQGQPHVAEQLQNQGPHHSSAP